MRPGCERFHESCIVARCRLKEDGRVLTTSEKKNVLQYCKIIDHLWYSQGLDMLHADRQGVYLSLEYEIVMEECCLHL